MKHLKNKLALASAMLFFSFSYAQNNVVTHVWSESGGLQSDRFSTPTAIDDYENYYRAGMETNNYSGNDAKLQQLDEEGNLIWTATLNTSSDYNSYEPSKIYCYHSDIYVTGIVTYFTNNETDFFIAKIDDNGSVIWFVTDNSPGNDISADLFYDDVSDQLMVCGTTERAGTYDLLLAAYDEDGIEQWISHKDYNGNYDGAAKLYRSGTDIVVNGSSQSSSVQWDIVSWFYDDTGVFISEERTNGHNSSADELKDATLNNGFIFMSGSSTGLTGEDMKVVCLDVNNNLLWSDSYDKQGLADAGRAIVASGNAFVVGGYTTDATFGKNLLARKYSQGGSLIWHAEFDYDGADDKVVDVIEDSDGNYLLLAQIEEAGQNDVYLYCLQGSTGNLLWTEAIANDGNKNETAISIEADLNGQIYVTYDINGIAATDYYAYSELNYPRDAEPHSKGALFIKNSGQILGTDNMSAPDIRYSSFGLFPDYYFTDNRISTVTGIHDSNDDLTGFHRVDYNFVDANATHIGQLEEYERNTHYNYYVDDKSYEKQKTFEALAWPEIYDDVNVIVSSNSEGFKMTIVLEAGADLSEIAIDIDGSNGVNLSNGDLNVQNQSGDVVWVEPFSYAQNGSIEDDDCISYSWVNDQLKLNSGTCELNYPYVIQLKVGTGSSYTSTPIGNLEWSTYYDGTGSEYCLDVAVDESNGDIFTTGFFSSISFPIGSGVDNSIINPSGADNHGIVVKFNHNAEIQWATVLTGTDLDLTFRGVGLYDNVTLTPDKEVHVVGDFIGTFTSDIPNQTLIQSGAWQAGTPPNMTEYEIVLASFRNDDGALLIKTSFGDPEDDRVHGMDITSGGLLYFYGRTKGKSTAGSSSSPPSYWTFPLNDPGDGSYFENLNIVSNPNIPQIFRGFVSAMDLSDYSLAYSSLIRKDDGSNKSEFEVIYDMDFSGNKAIYCGKATGGARLGSFDPSTNLFAPSLDQTNSEFTDKLYFSGSCISPAGNVFTGIDTDGSDPFLSTPDWRNFQISAGETFMLMLDNSNNIIWDSYFGDGSDMGFYWHGAGATSLTKSPTVYGKGKVAFNSTVNTFFSASSTGNTPVQTLDHPSFFHKNVNATPVLPNAQTIQADVHLNAFYQDGNLNLANHTWGTHFGGNSTGQTPLPFADAGTDYMAGIETYDYNGKSYVIIATTTFSPEGSETGDNTKFPIADFGQTNSWYQTKLDRTHFGDHVGMSISRFEVTNIRQGYISLNENLATNKQLHLYPNPSENVMNLIFKDGDIERLQIMDSMGRLLIDKRVTDRSSHETINLDQLAEGIYTLIVNEKYSSLFVKN